MHRMKADGSVAFASRALAPVGGTPQYATAGVPGTIPATVDTAYHDNMMQDELFSFIEAAGIAGDDTKWGQVWAHLFRAYTFADTGSAAHFVVNPPTMTWPFLAAHIGVGTSFRALMANAPSAGADLAFAGTTAKAVFLPSGSPLVGGEWRAGEIVEFVCTGAAYQMLGPIDPIIQSIGNTGYRKFPGGLILQWGQGSCVGGAAQLVTFPTAFPNGCFAVNVNDRAANAWTASNVTFYGASGASASGVTITAAVWNGSAFSVSGGGADRLFSYLATGF